MGQAKLRGTFEQRKAKAVERKEIHKQIYRSARQMGGRGALALAIGASLAGAVHWWPK